MRILDISLYQANHSQFTFILAFTIFLHWKEMAHSSITFSVLTGYPFVSSDQTTFAKIKETVSISADVSTKIGGRELTHEYIVYS